MRLGVIILALAAIAVTLVHLRRQEISMRHEIRMLEKQRVILARELAQRDVQIGRLTTPAALRQTLARMERLNPRPQTVACDPHLRPIPGPLPN